MIREIYKLSERLYLKFTHSFTLPTIDRSKHQIYLFGTVEHGNYGDQAITVAELEFLSHNMPNAQIISIPERFVMTAVNQIKAVINDDDIVVYHGGGNMGDIWPNHEIRRQVVFNAFKKQKIISMPQSVGYAPDGESLARTVEVLRTCRNIWIFARERNSYEFMRRSFPSNVHIGLVPDVVLSLKRVDNNIPRTYITAFLRKDLEKLKDSRLPVLLNRLRESNLVTLDDTVDHLRGFIPEFRREKLLEKKLVMFQKSKLIVTDRLHGAIFAAVTGTPAIIFDNNNHKIKFSYDTWLYKDKYLHMIDDVNIDEFRPENYFCVTPTVPYSFDKQFDSLKSALIG